MKTQIGTLEEGSPITMVESDGYVITVQRLIVGKQIQSMTGKPLVEVHRPHMKSVYTVLRPEELVYVKD